MTDEQLIRDLIQTWQDATRSGDLPKLLSMMDEDVVFLIAGKPLMRGRDAFAASFQTVMQNFRIDGNNDIQEIRVADGWAYCWTYLLVLMTPLQGGQPQRRSGYTLTVLRKNPDAAWVIFRDANLLAEVA